LNLSRGAGGVVVRILDLLRQKLLNIDFYLLTASLGLGGDFIRYFDGYFHQKNVARNPSS
jgi:hypothetical protein